MERKISFLDEEIWTKNFVFGRRNLNEKFRFWMKISLKTKEISSFFVLKKYYKFLRRKNNYFNSKSETNCSKTLSIQCKNWKIFYQKLIQNWLWIMSKSEKNDAFELKLGVLGRNIGVGGGVGEWEKVGRNSSSKNEILRPRTKFSFKNEGNCIG